MGYCLKTALSIGTSESLPGLPIKDWVIEGKTLNGTVPISVPSEFRHYSLLYQQSTYGLVVF